MYSSRILKNSAWSRITKQNIWIVFDENRTESLEILLEFTSHGEKISNFSKSTSKHTTKRTPNVSKLTENSFFGIRNELVMDYHWWFHWLWENSRWESLLRFQVFTKKIHRSQIFGPPIHLTLVISQYEWHNFQDLITRSLSEDE